MTGDTVRWPSLPFEEWRRTYRTLHMWLQVIGKIRLSQTPWINHSWHVTLYVTARGLTTGPIPHGPRIFQIDLDFIDHRLLILTGDGDVRTLELRPRSVADFYRNVLGELEALELPVRINARPNEVRDAVPFDRDRDLAHYEPQHANRLWRILAQSDRIFREFRSRFAGKASPVHFFWGSFDLAVTRFSGRPAPPHPGGVPNLPDWVAREAYSQEVSSAGFWPGDPSYPFPLFYSYAYPEPPGFSQASVAPETARYSAELREFILPYDDVRSADAPDAVLLAFLQSTYEAAAGLGGWDRSFLDRSVAL